MDLQTILALTGGVAFLLTIAALAVAGYARLNGRRSRLEGVARVLVASQAASVYPPSLRPITQPEVNALPTPHGDGLPPAAEVPLPAPHRPRRRRRRRSG